MKHKTKTITAITTIINGKIHYVSGHSVNAANKYIPQYNKDAQYAKEFNSKEGAEFYLRNVSYTVTRLFTVITIDILDLPDTRDALRKYDRSVINKIMLLLIISSIVLVSCSKSQIPQPKQSADKYQMIIEHYTMDTTHLVKRIIWWESILTDLKEKARIDTITGKWYLMCATDKLPQHFEYWYYMRNGKKIH